MNSGEYERIWLNLAANKLQQDTASHETPYVNYVNKL